MQCDICLRSGGSKLPFLCPVDARNALYEPRIQHARVLLEKDALDKQISAITAPEETESVAGYSGAGTSEPKSFLDVENSLAETAAAEERTRRIIEAADELRGKVQAARADIARRRAILERRRSELATAANGQDSRRAKSLEDLEKKTKMTNYKWNQLHTTTAQSRAFLCGEAAKLYGLQRLRSSNGGWSNEYSIANVNIVDLRAMNIASPAQITTALSHIAHLLVLATHYLAIRLPAEITLPHRDYPLPTILPLEHSYKHPHIPFPGSTPLTSSNTSPTASRHEHVPDLPRPRPLYIYKHLPILAKEDPGAYALFLEGATLLAYNIAWLCKSQYIPVGPSSPTTFENICAIGHNLHTLLIGTTPRPSPASRTSSTQTTPTKSLKVKFETDSERAASLSSGAGVGHYSHGTAHTPLTGSAGTEFVLSFKLSSPTRIADKLKSQLSSEINNAEWEFVDYTEHTSASEDGEGEGVIVGARRNVDRGVGGVGGISGHAGRGIRGVMGLGRGLSDAGAQSFMSMKTVVEAVEIMEGNGNSNEMGQDRKPGTSGWTKVKPR